MSQQPQDYESKEEFFQASKEFWNPGKTSDWQSMGVDLVIDRREGYHIYDMNGQRLIDAHLNGGTYNVGHRNPELVETLKSATDRFDIGNHHFPALARTALAEMLALKSPEGLKYTIYASGGGEAIDIAIKSARNATGRKKIVSIIKAYHGHTGLAVKAGDQRFSKIFLSEDRDGEFPQVAFNDLNAMEHALRSKDVAAVLMETIPATYGFPLPDDGYLQRVKALCEKYGTLYIADEVQTGLMRTGCLWAVERYGVVPDMLVTGKGISGGMYPIACVLANENAAQWLKQDGFGHISTFGGAEIGCVVAMKVLEMVTREGVPERVGLISDYISQSLKKIQGESADFFNGIRQSGLVIGLEFNHPEGGKLVMRHLYENGVWAIFSTLNPSVLQFKPGLFLSQEDCEDLMRRLSLAVQKAAAEAADNSRASERWRA